MTTFKVILSLLTTQEKINTKTAPFQHGTYMLEYLSLSLLPLFLAAYLIPLQIRLSS